MQFLDYSTGLNHFLNDLHDPKGSLSASLVEEIIKYLQQETDSFELIQFGKEFTTTPLSLMKAQTFLGNIPLVGYGLINDNEKFKPLFELLERYLFVKFNNWTPKEELNHKENINLDIFDFDLKNDSSIEGVSLNNLERKSIPRYLLGLSSNFERFTSIGCAIHSNSMSAVHNSLFEQIENHILNLHIINDLTPYEVIDSSNGTKQYLSGVLSEHGYRFKTLVFNKLQIPVFLSLILNENEEFPYLFYGVGCKANPEESLEKSLTEAFMCWSLEYPNAKSFYEKKDSIEGDVSKSAKFYDPKYSLKNLQTWFNCDKIKISEIVEKTNPEELLALIEELDFTIFPIVSNCGNITFVRSFSEKIIPKSLDKAPFLPTNHSISEFNKLKEFPY